MMPATKRRKRTVAREQPLLAAVEKKQEEEARVKIRATYLGVQLRGGNLPQVRKIENEHTRKLAETMKTKTGRIGTTKRLFDPAKNPLVKELNAARAEVERWFKDVRFTRYWPEPSKRRVKRTAILDGEFDIVSDEERNDGSHDIVYAYWEDGFKKRKKIIVHQAEYNERVESVFAHFMAELRKRIDAYHMVVEKVRADYEKIVNTELKELGSAGNRADYDVDFDNLRFEVSTPPLYTDDEVMEIDPVTYKAQIEADRQRDRETFARERQEQAELAAKYFDALALALSQRFLLDGEREIIVRKDLPDDRVEITYEDDAKTVQKLVLTAKEVAQRVSRDEKPRKFNDATALRLLSLREQIEERREEGIASPALDTISTGIEKLFGKRDGSDFLDELRTNEIERARVEAACLHLASQVLNSEEIAPRRVILRRGAKHPALQGG